MRHEDVARLLQDGVAVRDPMPGLLAAAEHLGNLGLIEPQIVEFVSCADPADADFSRSNRRCRGIIVLPQGGDEEDDDLRCPECDRLVYPVADAKRRRRELRVRVKHEAVLGFLRSLLADAFDEPAQVADGVLRVKAGALGIIVCVVDCCGDPKFVSRDWARTQPTCYVVVDPRLASRFLDEEWITRVSLADVVCGDADLIGIVADAAEAGAPTVLRNASVPVCAAGPRLPSGDDPSPASSRQFVVQLADDTVSIEGEPVMSAQAGTRYQIFRILWDRFLADLCEGRSAESFRVANLATILKELTDREGRQFFDEMNIRRTINRLQTDIMTALRRKRGLPVHREDIVETCPWNGQGQREYGYRLNPCMVAVRPRQARRRG